MDFIEQFSLSNGYIAILVIINWASKQGIFIPTYDTITSEQLACLFILHVFSKHGIPSHITLDRSFEFVSQFFRALGKTLNIELHFTSGYHPDTAPINRMIGINYSQLLSLHTIMHLTTLQVSLHSLQTRATTLVCLFI